MMAPETQEGDTLRRDTQTWPQARGPWLGLIAIGMLTLSLGACDDDKESPSTLEYPQILAVQVTPRVLTPGASHEARVLGHDLDDAALQWQACLIPWMPATSDAPCTDVAEVSEDLTAMLQALDLLEDLEDLQAPRTGNPVTFDAPDFPAQSCEDDADCGQYVPCVDGACQLGLSLRVEDSREEGALRTMLRLVTGEDTAHPEVTGLYTEMASSALPSTVEAGSELVVTPELTDPYGEGGLVVSYFTSGGAFDPWRTRDGAPSTWTAPDEAGEVTLTVIVRDPGGGVGWAQHPVTVTLAP